MGHGFVYPFRMWNVVVVFLTVGLVGLPHGESQVTPQQVAVITMAGSDDSREVAEYYCQFRELPTDRIIEIAFTEGVTLSRDAWEDQFRAEIANRLNEIDPDKLVTDLVVIYGTPLAVAAWEDDRELKQLETFYQKAMDEGVRRLNLSLAALSKLAEQEAVQISLPIDLTELRTIFQQQIEAAQKAIATRPAEKQPEDNAILQGQVQLTAGLFPFMSSLQQQMQNPLQAENVAELGRQLQYLRGRSEILTQTIQYLERMPATFERDATLLALLEQGGGLLDVLTWLQRQMDMVQLNDSMASLDSELALVFWDEYRRIGTVPNLLNPAFDGSPLRNVYRTLRVSRIDGPTAAVAKQLVDRTKEAEAATNVSGNVYIDLRGIQSGDPDLLQTENWLRAIGTQMKEVAGVKVEIEETARLFQSGQCPDTLVYLGWYSLGKFVDSCTFKPGAIAYHLVPDDALRLRDTQQQGWCRGFLESGATRVIGSVGEAVPVLLTIDPEAKKNPMSIRVVMAELSDGMILFNVP